MDDNQIQRIFQQILENNGMREMVYAFQFEQQIMALERKLHSSEDPEEIGKETLIAAMDFYDGDWCGIIEGDLEMEAWYPVLWHDKSTGGMTATHFHELEDTCYLNRWIEALNNCEPVMISDTSVFKDTNPNEYELYKRCHANSILAVPFWHNPTGFMIVRNPKRFVDRGGFLQATAYVAFTSVTERKLLSQRKNSHKSVVIKSETDVFVKLFGDMEIHTLKGCLTEEMINSPKYCCILAYFLLGDRRPKPAQQVWRDIWPDDNIEHSGTNMRSLFLRFKDVFSFICDQRLIVSSKKGYQLNPELNIVTDVNIFDEYLEKADKELTAQAKIEFLKKALDIYTDNLFPSGGSEHWILNDELKYKYKCLAIYNELMKSYFETCNYVRVEHYAEEALSIEPANEDAYYWLIRVMKMRNSNVIAKGQLHMAKHVLDIGEYERLEKRLAETTD
ncbi:MAG: hypothetical protein E7253_07235 [Lachnospiraceae bacterium]|nr:hypothetical protein [Lachnospiraceae bacterium]